MTKTRPPYLDILVSAVTSQDLVTGKGNEVVVFFLSCWLIRVRSSCCLVVFCWLEVFVIFFFVFVLRVRYFLFCSTSFFFFLFGRRGVRYFLFVWQVFFFPVRSKRCSLFSVRSISCSLFSVRPTCSLSSVTSRALQITKQILYPFLISSSSCSLKTIHY